MPPNESPHKARRLRHFLLKLQRLNLCFAYAIDSDSSRDVQALKQALCFFRQMPRSSLKPAFRGYYPTMNFRAIAFSRIQTLVLSGFSFSHNWQIESSLGLKTLRLILDYHLSCHAANAQYGLFQKAIAFDHFLNVLEPRGLLPSVARK